jgi:uncharacterized protein (DUF1697 family)
VPVRTVALLRGINVGPSTAVGMPALTALFQAQGLTDVTTYLRSGNVVFTGEADEKSLGRAISEEFGRTVPVLLRTAAELGEVVDGNPYVDRQDDPTKLHVTFLATRPSGTLAVPDGGTDELTLGAARRLVYLHCPNGYGRTKVDNAFVERALGVAATTRNWKSVLALHELATRDS